MMIIIKITVAFIVLLGYEIISRRSMLKNMKPYQPPCIDVQQPIKAEEQQPKKNGKNLYLIVNNK